MLVRRHQVSSWQSQFLSVPTVVFIKQLRALVDNNWSTPINIATFEQVRIHRLVGLRLEQVTQPKSIELGFGLSRRFCGNWFGGQL